MTMAVFSEQPYKRLFIAASYNLVMRKPFRTGATAKGEPEVGATCHQYGGPPLHSSALAKAVGPDGDPTIRPLASSTESCVK